MQRYAALLRGITPSGKNMTNDKLRAVAEGLGFSHVGSVLSSGNLVFAAEERSAPTLERRIERALHSELGIGGCTIIRSLPELEALLASDPFHGYTHGRGTYLTVTFLQQPLRGDLDAEEDPLATLIGYDADARAVLAVIDNSTPGATPASMGRLEKAHGTAITTRTWPTVQKIVAKLAALPE